MAGEFEDRDRQMREISNRLGEYQQRYPELHLASEYRDWVLETKAAGKTLLDYTQDFLRRLERRKRRVAELAGDIDYDAAVGQEDLRAGFRRLVNALDHYKTMNAERIAGYSQEIESYGCTGAEFDEVVGTLVRELKRFPYVRELIGGVAVIRRRTQEAERARRVRHHSEEFDAEMRRRREVSAAIEEMPDDERAEIEAEAEAEVAKLPAWFGAGLRETCRRVAMRVAYERRYEKEAPLNPPVDGGRQAEGSEPASVPGDYRSV